jgi:hypothetical protein
MDALLVIKNGRPYTHTHTHTHINEFRFENLYHEKANSRFHSEPVDSFDSKCLLDAVGSNSEQCSILAEVGWKRAI